MKGKCIWNAHKTKSESENTINRGRNKVFCLTSHFWCSRKSHCRSPIATDGFGCAVSPYSIEILLKPFPISAINKCLICRKSTFSHLFYSIFFQKISSSIVILFQTPLKSKVEQGLHFRKNQHSWLHNIIAHKHSIKHNPFD